MVTLDMNTPFVQYLCKKDELLAKVISADGPISDVPYIKIPKLMTRSVRGRFRTIL